MESKQVKFYTYHSNGDVAEIRRQSVEFTVLRSWEAMCSLFSGFIKVEFPGFYVEYVDNEGDKVAVRSSVDWEECIRLCNSSCDHSPLRIHIRKSEKQKGYKERRAGAIRDKTTCSSTCCGTGSSSPGVEASHFYFDGEPNADVPNSRSLQDIQESVLSVLAGFLPAEWMQRPAELPMWLRPAARLFVQGNCESSVDFNIPALDGCLMSRALSIMNQDPLEAERLLTISSKISPSCIKTYNLACCMQGGKAAAIDLLRSAVEQGYSDADHAMNDSDLSSLCDEPEFQSLLIDMRDKARNATLVPANEPDPPKPRAHQEFQECEAEAQVNAPKEAPTRAHQVPTTLPVTVPAPVPTPVELSRAIMGTAQTAVGTVAKQVADTSLQAAANVASSFRDFLAPFQETPGKVPAVNATEAPIPTGAVTSTPSTATTTTTATTTAITTASTTTTESATAEAPNRVMQIASPFAFPIRSRFFQPPPRDSFPYSKELQRLAEMGFFNDALNRQLLLDTHGSVNLVIDRLLQHYP